MKEIKIASIVVTFIGLCLLALTVMVSIYRCKSNSTEEFEQAAKPDLNEVIVFVMPDGALYIPAEELEGRKITFTFTD